MNSITDDTQLSDSAPGGLRARLERYERSAGGGIQPLANGNGSAEPPAVVELDEPISPELVLVDPELAARARALLPDPRPFTAPDPEPEPEYDPEANRVVLGDVEPAVEPAPLPRRRSRKRRAAAYALALAVLAAVAGAIAFAVLSWSGSDSTAPNTPGPIPPVKQPPPSAQPPAPTTSPRSFVWAPVHGASFYLVQFYRSGTEIFRARPSQARVVVPASWSYKGHDYSLEPGKYRWSVRPRLGKARKHYGQPVVLSQLVVQRASSGGGQSTRNP